MLMTKSGAAVSEPLPSAVSTRADDESPVSGNAALWREEWQRIIDDVLIEWGCNPNLLQDDGVTPPSRETIQLAGRFAQLFRDSGAPPPTKVARDPNGGIVFERRVDDRSEVVHIWEDGTSAYRVFKGTKMVCGQ